MGQNALFASEPWNLVATGYAETTMFGALRANKPDLLQPQRAIATLENPERFKQEKEEAGACNVEIRCITKAFPIPEFWDFMVNGSAPIQMMKKSKMSVRGEPVEPYSNTTGEELRREKEKIALAWLEETLPTLKKPLTSDAWLGVGVK